MIIESRPTSHNEAKRVNRVVTRPGGRVMVIRELVKVTVTTAKQVPCQARFNDVICNCPKHSA